MKRHLLLALLLSALALPSRARADDAAVAEATQRFNEGLQLADSGKHEEARLKFQQAAAVLKAPSVLFNLARAEQLTGNELDAVEHFKQFLRGSQNDPKITDAMRDKARQHIAALSSKLGQIEVDAPASARISIDGKPIEDPLREPVTVQPGRHVVEATFEGRVKSVTVECAVGVVTRAKIELDAAAVPFTEPPAKERTGKPDLTRWIVGGAIGAAGLVSFGLGVGFGVSSQSAKADAEELRRANRGLCATPPTPACATYDGKRSDAESASTVSTIGYVAGGVLVAGAVATVLLWPKAKESSRRTVTPWASRDALGAAIGGSF
jgi:hypothetical protein